MTGRALNGRTSLSMGSNDPRHRRNASAGIAESDIQINRSLRLDDRQRLGLAGVSDIGDPPAEINSETAVYLTKLVTALRQAGVLRGGG